MFLIPAAFQEEYLPICLSFSHTMAFQSPDYLSGRLSLARVLLRFREMLHVRILLQSFGCIPQGCAVHTDRGCYDITIVAQLVGGESQSARISLKSGQHSSSVAAQRVRKRLEEQRG
jgi:hypothetical protein